MGNLYLYQNQTISKVERKKLKNNQEKIANLAHAL